MALLDRLQEDTRVLLQAAISSIQSPKPSSAHLQASTTNRGSAPISPPSPWQLTWPDPLPPPRSASQLHHFLPSSS